MRKGQEQRVGVSTGSWVCGRSRCFQVNKGARVRTGCFSRNEDEKHWEAEKPGHPSGQTSQEQFGENKECFDRYLEYLESRGL